MHSHLRNNKKKPLILILIFSSQNNVQMFFIDLGMFFLLQ